LKALAFHGFFAVLWLISAALFRQAWKGTERGAPTHSA
jgi:hypothetical protein